ncbi:MAG TPA: MBL fold metallo-hydrolase [Thermoplasmata archaeon]|nr:MBL fold metallo-hydrolase [Thermoplasmata archaeon]
MSAAALPHPYFRPQRQGAVSLVAPASLATELAGGEPPYLLDVRPPRERELAHLAGDHPIPLAELPGRLGEIPRDRTVVVYCQFGSQARRAAAFLEAQGWEQVAALEGGLDEYARLVDPSIPRYQERTGDRLFLRQFPRRESGCLSYLLADPVDHAAVLLDPGHEVEPYLAELRRGDWKLRAIVETHTHADHLAGHAALSARTGAPIFLSRRSPANYPHRTLADGEGLGFGSEELLVWETPGHTRDHLTLRVAGKAFTGDTLLLGSCGRTDLGDGDPNQLWESLTDKILSLPAETEVFPAHYGARHALPERYVSSVGFERASNEALTQGSREAFLKYMTEGWPPKPADFDRIVAANLSG